LIEQIPLFYTKVEEKKVGEKKQVGYLSRLSRQAAEITFSTPIDSLTNLKLRLHDVEEQLSVKSFYGKVINLAESKEQNTYLVSFTAMPPEVSAYFQACRQYAVAKSPSLED
jgi:hypothetical protein